MCSEFKGVKNWSSPLTLHMYLTQCGVTMLHVTTA